jgi:hypothetical protein
MFIVKTRLYARRAPRSQGGSGSSPRSGAAEKDAPAPRRELKVVGALGGEFLT